MKACRIDLQVACCLRDTNKIVTMGVHECRYQSTTKMTVFQVVAVATLALSGVLADSDMNAKAPVVASLSFDSVMRPAPCGSLNQPVCVYLIGTFL